MLVADMRDGGEPHGNGRRQCPSCAGVRRRRGSPRCRNRAPSAARRSAPWRWPVGGRSACSRRRRPARRNGVRKRVDRGEIGFQVDHRRAVQHVDAVERQTSPRRCRWRSGLHDMQADRVRPGRRAQRENAFWFSGVAGFLDNQIPRREVEPGQSRRCGWCRQDRAGRGDRAHRFQCVACMPVARAAAMFFGQSSRARPRRADASDEHDMAVAASCRTGPRRGGLRLLAARTSRTPFAGAASFSCLAATSPVAKQRKST